MNTILCLAVLLACTAMALAETCSDANDCSHVTCPEHDYTKECVSGQCTCTHATLTCSGPHDCSNLPNCHQQDEHCIDGQCRCGLFPVQGGGPIGPIGK